MGVIGYGDDLIILAPCRRSAQKMLEICDNFAQENNIRFSTDKNPSKSKSKAIYVVGNNKVREKPEPLALCGERLPWVERAVHLGHSVTSDGSMRQDTREKVAEFIDTTVKLRETFDFAEPQLKVKASNYLGMYREDAELSLKTKSLHLM